MSSVAKVQEAREDDDVLRQLRSTQVHISIWSLLASLSRHREALAEALARITINYESSPEGYVSMVIADRPSCIVFSDAKLPPKG